MPSFIALNTESIQQNLSTDLIHTLSIFTCLDSTNQWALQYAQCGEVCLSEQQTAGRGRQGKIWHSPQNSNIYLSLKYCFDTLPEHMGLLSLVVAVAVAETLHDMGLRDHGIKWPNDILWQGKKLAGILIESKGTAKHVVIGIGINVHMPETDNIDQAWVSLHHILPHITDRNRVVSQLLNILSKYLANFMTLDFSDFIHTWQHWDLLKQHYVHAQYANKSLYGQVIGINSYGALQLQLVNGTTQTLYAAEVSIRKKP